MSNLTLKDFEVSEFNVLRGNVSDSRESRDKTTVNTDEGLSTDTGILSQAQDSNYSLESWTRGRYTGTEQTYLIGNNPSLSLSPLNIAVFDKNTEDKTIGDLLRSTPRSPKFEEGYFVTYVRQADLKTVPTPSIASLSSTSSEITLVVNNNNNTNLPITTEFRIANREWFTFPGGVFNDQHVSNLQATIKNLSPDTEFTFQVRNKMRSPEYKILSTTITENKSTARKQITATFIHFQDQKTFLANKLSPLSIGFDEPVRFGFDFKGWEPSLPRTITEDTIFIAQWEKLPEEFSDPVTPQLGEDVFLTSEGFGCGINTTQPAKSTQDINTIFPGSTKIRKTNGEPFPAGRYGLGGSNVGSSATAEIELDPTGRVISFKTCP